MSEVAQQAFKHLLSRPAPPQVKDKSSTSPPSSSAQSSFLSSSFQSASTVPMLVLQAQQQTQQMLDMIQLNAVQPQLKGLQETLQQLSCLVDSTLDGVSAILNANKGFTREVVKFWQKPQYFLDSFTQNHIQLAQFMLWLHKRPTPDEHHLNMLEEQILKSLNLKAESDGNLHGGRNRTGSDTDLDQILQQSIDSSKQLSSKQSSGKSLTEAQGQRKKNMFGLDFEIPDELHQLIAKELKSKQKSKPKAAKTDYLNPPEALASVTSKLVPQDSKDQLTSHLEDAEGNLFGYSHTKMQTPKLASPVQSQRKAKGTAETPAFGKTQEKGFFKEFQSPTVSQFQLQQRKVAAMQKSQIQRAGLEQEIRRSLSNSKQQMLNRVGSASKQVHKPAPRQLKQSIVSDFTPAVRTETSKTPPNRTSVQTLNSFAMPSFLKQQSARNVSRSSGALKTVAPRELALQKQRASTSRSPQRVAVQTTVVPKRSSSRTQ